MAIKSLDDQFAEVLKEAMKEVNENLEPALTSAAEVLRRNLAAASPVGDDAEHFKDCWVIKTKYSHVRYVGNSKTVSGGIPLANLIEYSKNGHPFIMRTFEQSKAEIYSTFAQELGGKLK